MIISNHRRPAYCRVRLQPARATSYGLSARQVRNCIALGCVGGLLFMVIAFAVMG